MLGTTALVPPDDLLSMPASFFWWIAPGKLEIQTGLSEMHHAEKSSRPISEPPDWNSTVWDRELDGGP